MAFKMKGSAFYGRGNQSTMKKEDGWWDTVKDTASDVYEKGKEVAGDVNAIASGVGGVLSNMGAQDSHGDLPISQLYKEGKQEKEDEQDGKEYKQSNRQLWATYDKAYDKWVDGGGKGEQPKRPS